VWRLFRRKIRDEEEIMKEQEVESIPKEGIENIPEKGIDLLGAWVDWYQVDQSPMTPDARQNLSQSISLLSGFHHQQLPIQYVNDESIILLQNWFEWWENSADVPAKLPHALHVRTAVFLVAKDYEGKDSSSLRSV
jgi:hypothetical protein